MYKYIPKGVCSKEFNFEVIDNKVINVTFTGGCDGNLQGLSKLLEGMDVNEVYKRLNGIRCGRKITSCPDQFAIALKELKITK